MSDTPRTDEVLEMYFHARGTMLAKLAKELERELGDLISLLASEKSTRNHLIKRGAELERELDDLKSQRADFGALVDKMERELDAAKAKLKEAYDDLLNIATMPEYDRDDCHRLRNLGMRGASNLQAFIK